MRGTNTNLRNLAPAQETGLSKRDVTQCIYRAFYRHQATKNTLVTITRKARLTLQRRDGQHVNQRGKKTRGKTATDAAAIVTYHRRAAGS